MKIKYGHILKRLERRDAFIAGLWRNWVGGVSNVQRPAKKQNCDEYDDDDRGFEDFDDRASNGGFSHARDGSGKRRLKDHVDWNLEYIKWRWVKVTQSISKVEKENEIGALLHATTTLRSMLLFSAIMLF